MDHQYVPLRPLDDLPVLLQHGEEFDLLGHAREVSGQLEDTSVGVGPVTRLVRARGHVEQDRSQRRELLRQSRGNRLVHGQAALGECYHLVLLLVMAENGGVPMIMHGEDHLEADVTNPAALDGRQRGEELSGVFRVKAVGEEEGELRVEMVCGLGVDLTAHREQCRQVPRAAGSAGPATAVVGSV